MDKEIFNYYKNALVDNLCSEYKGYWQAAMGSKEKLMRLAMSQQALPHLLTYCYQGRGVTKEYILGEFSEYINGRGKIFDADGVNGYTYQLYVAFSDLSALSDDVSAFMWCNCPSVEINRTKCPIMYIACSSDIHLTLDGYNSVIIYLFDDSNVTIEDADDTCSVTIYKYSQKAQVELGKYCISNKVKTFCKELRL